MPEFYVLTLIAKIHLVKAHARGEFAAAIDDVRHLAKLYFTHEYLLSTMLGIALLNVTQNVATSLKEPFTAIESKEALLALRQRLFVSMYSINALAEPALAQTTAGAPRFVRCVLLTEQSYMRTVTSLPADADCWFENARFELAHPWQREEEDAFVALSPPAMLGGWIVHAVYPSGVRQLEKDLRAADQLPTDDGWARTESEYLGRLLRH